MKIATKLQDIDDGDPRFTLFLDKEEIYLTHIDSEDIGKPGLEPEYCQFYMEYDKLLEVLSDVIRIVKALKLLGLLEDLYIDSEGGYNNITAGVKIEEKEMEIDESEILYSTGSKFLKLNWAH